MKLILILLISISIISCSTDRKQGNATNALCTKSNLVLKTYKPANSKTVDHPSNPNKSDDDIRATDGIYILSGSKIHAHDMALPTPDKFETEGPEFLQFGIAFTAVPQSDADKEENIQSFNSSIDCLSGLMPNHAGNASYLSNIPTTIEVKNLGSEISTKAMNTIEFSYEKDQSIKIIANPITDKSTSGTIDKINESSGETVTNLYRTTPTSEVYQLQSRVNQGDVVLTVINTYIRCVDPSEEPETEKAKENKEARTQEQTDQLQENYELCQSRIIKLNSKK